MTKTKNQLERIAKSIASTGYCSRRAAEKLISMGKVKVNEKLILTPAYFVSKKDKITVEGSLIKNKKHIELYIFHKPYWYLKIQQSNLCLYLEQRYLLRSFSCLT